jgi:predicted RNase H-like HicB family nuclease
MWPVPPINQEPLINASPFWRVWRAKGRSVRSRIKDMARQFDVVIERDEEGMYMASVPQLPGCHTDAASLDELMVEIREAIELCLEVEDHEPSALEFIGIQRVTVAA